MRNGLAAVVAFGVLVFWPTPTEAEWFTEGVRTNPAINTIMFDSGPYNRDGAADFLITCTSTVLTFVDVELRDTTNTVTLRDQHIATSGDTTQVRLPVDFLTGQRIRGRLAAAITGSAQCSMHGPPSS